MASYLKSASTALLIEKATAAKLTASHSFRSKKPLHAQANMRLWDAAFEELERRWLEAFPPPRLVVHPLSPSISAVQIEGAVANHGAFEVFTGVRL